MATLSKEQRISLTELLQQQRHELRAAIRDELLQNQSEGEAELSGTVHDASEESVAELVSEMNTALLSRSIQELRQVEEALTRIETDDYGICEECGEAIPFERLQANPITTLCLEHQEEQERRSKR